MQKSVAKALDGNDQKWYYSLMGTLEQKKNSNGKRPWKAITYEVTSTGCWICTSHKPSGSGYPRIRRNGKLLSLHRYVYMKYNGPIPKGYCVMHTCDNRMCINPKHLEVGTIADNNHDMFLKGRGFIPHNDFVPEPRRGEENNLHKLTEELVKEIRKRYREEEITFTELGKQYSVHRCTISLLIKRRTWKHV